MLEILKNSLLKNKYDKDCRLILKEYNSIYIPGRKRKKECF